VIFGNCGVGFAPVRKGAAPCLINLMEGVEDIPGTVLAEGVKFDVAQHLNQRVANKVPFYGS
jgi:N-acyl-D-aspartate/D-glutamate deacylase